LDDEGGHLEGWRAGGLEGFAKRGLTLFPGILGFGFAFPRCAASGFGESLSEREVSVRLMGLEQLGRGFDGSNGSNLAARQFRRARAEGGFDWNSRSGSHQKPTRASVPKKNSSGRVAMRARVQREERSVFVRAIRVNPFPKAVAVAGTH
jgi:hypothetical protein